MIVYKREQAQSARDEGAPLPGGVENRLADRQTGSATVSAASTARSNYAIKGAQKGVRETGRRIENGTKKMQKVEGINAACRI